MAKQQARGTDASAQADQTEERGMFDGQVAGNTDVNETEVRRTGKIPDSVREAANDTDSPRTPTAQDAEDARTGVPQNERVNEQVSAESEKSFDRR